MEWYGPRMATELTFDEKVEGYLRPLPTSTYRDIDLDYYGGPPYVWEHCYGNDRPAKDTTNEFTFGRTGKRTFECVACNFGFPEELLRGPMMEDAKLEFPPLHDRRLNVYQQAEKIVGDVAEILGFDRWDDLVLSARSAATDREQRTHSVDKMVSVGLSHLALTLATRSAVKEASQVAAEMLTFKCDQHEHPFFTEATLYELLGKEDARTVLHYVKALVRATAATRPTESEDA